MSEVRGLSASRLMPYVSRLLLHPIRHAQDAIDAWVLARVRRSPGPVSVARHRIYILPTRFGYAFALLLLILLLGAMNYSNSMIFALTFLLAGLGLIAMHHTHGNLVNLELRPGPVKPVFAGEIAHFEIHIFNPAHRERYSVSAGWPRAQAAMSADIPPEDTTVFRLPLIATRRGRLPARAFAIATEFPLGLFRAWTWQELDMAGLIYPRPAPTARTLPTTQGAGGTRSGPRSGLDEFSGLRNYQRGDTPRAIHWKSFPKLRRPMVKQFQETLEQELWLDWEALQGLETETRLSQLTRWVLDAENASLNYGLRLPGTRLAPSRGIVHQQACLKALALYPA